MTHTTMKTFALLLFVSLGLSFSSISSGFAQEMNTPELKAPPALTPVKSAWEPWDKKTLQLQLLVIPAAIGVGAANSFFSRTVYKPQVMLFMEEKEEEDLFIWTSAVFGYTLSQGLLIGAVGDAMGGDGGFGAPVAAGFLIPWIWLPILGLMFSDPYDFKSIPVIVTTTFVAQIVAYHLSASFYDDAAVKRQSSSIFNLSFGITPTDGGASLGLGFQF